MDMHCFRCFLAVLLAMLTLVHSLLISNGEYEYNIDYPTHVLSVNNSGLEVKFCSLQEYCYCTPLNNFTSSSPHCQSDCLLYGDCGLFYDTCVIEEPAQAIRDEYARYKPHITCHQLTDSHYYVMITSCPSEAESYLVNKCRSKVEKWNLYIGTPVSKRSFQFNNVYCALCNGNTLDEIEYWGLLKQGKEISTFDLKQAHVPFDVFFLEVQLSEPQQEWHFFRKPMKKQPRTCLLDKPTNVSCAFLEDNVDNIAEMCQKYYSPIATLSRKLLKNYFCLVCLLQESNDSSVVSKHKDLSCLPVGTKQELIRGSVFNSLASWTLTDLFRPRSVSRNCVGHTVADDCTFIKSKCRPGYIQRQKTCVLDPLDSTVFAIPINRGVAYTAHFDLVLPRPIIVVTAKASVINDKSVSDLFKDGLQSALNIGKITEIISHVEGKHVLQRPISSEAVEITFQQSAKIEFILHIEVSNNFSSLQNIHSHVVALQQNIGWERLATITNRQIVSEPYCHNGAHIARAIDNDTFAWMETLSESEFQMLFLTANSSDYYIHVCDLLSELTEQCPDEVIRGFTSDFTSDGQFLNSDSGSRIPEAAALLLNKSIFLCATNLTTITNSSVIVGHYFTIVLMSLSLFALVFVLVIYCAHSELRNIPGIMIMNLAIALFFSYGIFLMQMFHTSSSAQSTGSFNLCLVLAALTHYFWLCEFFWLTSIACDTARTFHKLPAISDQSYTLKLALMFSYGLPFVMVSVCLLCHNYLNAIYTPSVNKNLNGTDVQEISRSLCWIRADKLPLVFIAPLIVSYTVNVVMFIVTARALCKLRRSSICLNKTGSTIDFAVFVKLALLFGVTLGLAILVSFLDNAVLGYLNIIFNSSIGLYMGASFGLSDRARRLWCCPEKNSRALDSTTKTQATRTEGD